MKNERENSTKYDINSKCFDMDEKFEDVIKEKPKRRLSVSTLAQSIDILVSESGKTGENCDFESRNYLKINGSDIITRLRTNLNIDVHPCDEDSDKLKFQKLQVLKAVCIAEKVGEKLDESNIWSVLNRNKKYRKDELPEYKIPLIDILAMPTLAYIENDYSSDCIYTSEFERVVEQFRMALPDADEIEKKIYKVHENWKRVLFSTDIGLSLTSPYDKCKDQNKKNNSSDSGDVEVDDRVDEKLMLAQKTYDSISNKDVMFEMNNAYCCPDDSAGINENYNPIKAFFIRLITTKIRAEILDYHRLRNFDSKEIHWLTEELDSLEAEKTEKFNKHSSDSEKDKKERDKIKNALEKIQQKRKFLVKYFTNEEPVQELKEIFLYDLFYDKKISFNEFKELVDLNIDFNELNLDRKNVWDMILLKSDTDILILGDIYRPAYDFAVKYSVKTAEIFNNYYKSVGAKSGNYEVDDNQQLSVYRWCIIFRELMYIYLKEESFDNSRLFYNNKRRKLTAVLKLDGEFNSVSYMILVKHIYDRETMLYSSAETVRMRQKIDKQILDYEDFVLQNYDINNIEKNTVIMCYALSVMTMSNALIDIEYISLVYELDDFVCRTAQTLSDKIGDSDVFLKPTSLYRGYKIELSKSIVRIVLCSMVLDVAYRNADNPEMLKLQFKLFQCLLNFIHHGEKNEIEQNAELEKIESAINEISKCHKELTASKELICHLFNAISDASAEEISKEYKKECTVRFQDVYIKMEITFEVNRLSQKIYIKNCSIPRIEF